MSSKTYGTFVVRLQSRIKLKSNRLLGTESGRLPLLMKMSLARELHWVDALLPGVRNLLDVHSKTKQLKGALSYGIIRFDTRRG